MNFDGEKIYDKFVRPKSFVTDFRTKYSGVRKGDLRKGQAITLEEVRSHFCACTGCLQIQEIPSQASYIPHDVTPRKLSSEVLIIIDNISMTIDISFILYIGLGVFTLILMV